MLESTLAPRLASVTARASTNNETDKNEIVTNASKEVQSSRQMDSKMKRVRCVLRDLFIIVCLFIPCIVIWLSRAVISLMWKVHAYVQSEWERFNDIYFENTAIGKDVDPAFLAYMEGVAGGSVAGLLCCNHTSASRELSRRSKFLGIVNSVAHGLLFVPEKIYAYVQRVLEDYHNIYGDSMEELPDTEPAFIAYLKGEEGAPFLKNPHVTFSRSDSRDFKNCVANSDIESRNQRQGENGKVTGGFSLVRLVYKLFCAIRSAVSALYFCGHRLTFRGQLNNEEKLHFETSQENKHPRFNERKAHNVDKAANHFRQAVKLQETVTAHPGTVPSSAAFAVGSDRGHLFNCSGALRKPWNNPVNLRVPSNTGPKLWSSSLHSEAGKKQCNADPAVAKRTELFSKGKANGELKQPSTLRSLVDSAGSASACKAKTEKKVKERAIPFLFSVANEETPAPTLPVKEEGKGKVMPSVILTSHAPVLPRVKPQDQEKATGVVRSNQVRSANVCADSEPVPTQNRDTSSVEEPIEVKQTGSRVKQAQNKKECSEGKPRQSPLSADAPLRQARTVRFRTDSEADANHNHVTSSPEEQANVEPNISGVKRAKDKHGCLEDTSKKYSSLEDVHLSQFCSANVSRDSHAISTHSHGTSSAEEQIEVKPEVSRAKETKNKELRRKKFRETASSRDARSRHFKSANVCGVSQVSVFKTSGMSSVEEQSVEEPLVARTKRTRNEEECKQPRSWDAQACINSTEHPSNVTLVRNTRHDKRKAGSISDAVSISKQTEFISRQMHRVDVQKTAEQQELMEVVDSPPERAFTLPEPMETGGEENAKIFLFGEPSEAKAPFSVSFMEELESMETDQQESGIFLGEETEEMETNQASVFDAFSFAWANVMQSFLVQTVQPAEELMETDQGAVVASPCVAQLEEIMETMQEPFQTSMPFGQVGYFNLPAPIGMGTSEASFAVPVQEETMEIQEPGDAFKAVETKLGELADAKRPLASTVRMPMEEAILTNTPATKEPVVQTVKEPVVQTVKEPVVQTVKEPLVQTVKEPAMPPLKERTMPPPLVKTELLQSTQPSALIYSKHLQIMESKLNNELGFKTIEQQQLVAVETDGTKSASQLTMEQLQLVPEDPHFLDGLDSDSDSDDLSDDEYELDLATIDEFSELHTEPEHVQLIMKLLTQKELASEQ